MTVDSWQLTVGSWQNVAATLLGFPFAIAPNKRNVGANPPWLPLMLDRPIAPNFSKLFKKM
ncbi:MAG: hypothetical protein ABI180_08895 [Microcoleus sp.]